MMSHIFNFINNTNYMKEIPLSSDILKNENVCLSHHFSPFFIYKDKYSEKNIFMIDSISLELTNKTIEELIIYNWSFHFHEKEKRLYIIGKLKDENMGIYIDTVFIEINRGKKEIIDRCF